MAEPTLAELDDLTLPHGGRGFDLAGFAIEFKPDKVIFTSRRPEDPRFTFHLGPESGVFDLHRTWNDGRHETVFAIRREDLFRMLEEIGPELLRLHHGLWRKLKIGWLARQRIGISWGMFPMTSKALALVSKRNKRRRLDVDVQRLEEQVVVPEYLDDLFDMPDGAFMLVQHRRWGSRWLGMGLKATAPDGRVLLRWMRLRDVEAMQVKGWSLLQEAAKPYAIPPERYGDYPFLSQGQR